MAVVIFLVLVVLVVVAWTVVAFLRGSKEVADENADITTGHELPSDKGEAPSLLEEDLSFANRPTEAGRTKRSRERQHS